MRSAYGFTIPSEDRDLTHVEAGSPMGELMRRYWQPVCLSDEIKDLPRRVKLLCEDLVAFRDKKGRPASSRKSTRSSPRRRMGIGALSGGRSASTATGCQ